MTRVTFGVTSSPNILGEVISKILDDGKERYPRAVDLLRRCFYVDDFVASVNDEEIARDISHEAVKIMKAGSMHLRKWNSNSLLVRNSHPSEIPPPEMQKVLGVCWFVVADELSVDLNAVEVLLNSNSLNGTKRNVLKVMSKIYDPFGLLGPWVVRLKILFQSIWKQNLDWDEGLPSELQKIWTECYADVSELSQLMIPRCVLNEEGSTQIHIFADASQHAFGAVAFLRIADNDGTITPRFLCAKNRIAPIKNKDRDELTVPKLELTAALLAARLLLYLRTNLQIKFDEEFLWTDSRIALFWILGKEKRWKPYVENRVREIRTLTKISCWRHCPGSQNPADLLTRGINALSLIQSSEWLSGPDWLRKEATFWPTVNEYKLDTPQALSLFVAGEEEKEESTKINNSVIPCKKFSSWKRLLRTTAYCFRAIDCFKKKQRHDKYASYEDVPFLTASEMDRAENYWVSEAQRLHFNSEIESLTQNKGIPLNSKLLMFSPVLDQNSGHLRVGGRLHFVSSEIQAHPVILPKSSHISKLIVNDAHKKLFHAGVSSVLTHLRSSYWIIKGRQLVKSEVKSCSICKVLRAMPATQPFAPLPRDRITFSSPFDVTGLDFAGPLYTYDSGQKSKAYIMLFTCASIRAVHLELTSDLTTESCLLGIRRFIARRGVPRVIWSDNAATFKKSSKEFFKWRFIVERAPWWGGFWERLVGVVKSALRAAIGKATLNTNQLYTFLTEVENVVNNRPLTYVADEPLDLSPLTPSQLLRGPQASQLNESSSTEDDRSQGPEVLRKRWKERLQYIASFKRRWYNEYIQQLMSFHKSKYHRSIDLEIGDVVLMEDRSLPKTLWHLGIIVNIFPGRDGKVRACEVRISDGRTFRRPIQLLYPLEITYRRKDGGPEDVVN
ncbi:uncharacterized protein LOC129953417 [Eupeodes corollae]|uniref:uncharacterized protein LOC129953417 n=1 Tax=Eupeodes corollae TaxID=290404 RepID=UPI00248FFA3B|nr:uncharacterized protein LOC129953417 [Eupeodes corollae]